MCALLEKKQRLEHDITGQKCLQERNYKIIKQNCCENTETFERKLA